MTPLTSSTGRTPSTIVVPAGQTPPPYLLVLGIAQDAGYPQAGCRRACCAPAWGDPALRRHAACVAVVDPASGRRWLIDATPDFRAQLHRLDQMAPCAESPGLAGIFLTHAHVGHYTGLIHLGREAMGARAVPVYAMPRLAGFLRANQPWAELVGAGHVVLRPLADGTPVPLSPEITLTPFLVPHRDEHSETVGFRIQGAARAILYLPDIDGWEAWERQGTRIEAAITAVDLALVDGTFFAEDEIPGRSIVSVPHPLIVSTLARLAGLPPAERAKLRFTHLNHSNPALDPRSAASRAIAAAGCGVARELERVVL